MDLSEESSTSAVRHRYCHTLDTGDQLKSTLRNTPLKPILEQNEASFKAITFQDTLMRNHLNRVNFAYNRFDEQSKDIGWGSLNPDLRHKQQIRALDTLPHVRWWDQEKSQQFTKLPGQHGTQIDRDFGFSFDDLEGISLRQQREIIKNRVKELQTQKRMMLHTRFRENSTAFKDEGYRSNGQSLYYGQLNNDSRDPYDLKSHSVVHQQTEGSQCNSLNDRFSSVPIGSALQV